MSFQLKQIVFFKPRKHRFKNVSDTICSIIKKESEAFLILADEQGQITYHKFWGTVTL